VSSKVISVKAAVPSLSLLIDQALPEYIPEVQEPFSSFDVSAFLRVKYAVVDHE